MWDSKCSNLLHLNSKCTDACVDVFKHRTAVQSHMNALVYSCMYYVHWMCALFFVVCG